MKSIYSLSLDEMQDWLEDKGEKPYRADQIWQWLYRHHVASYDEMTNIPKTIL